MSPFKRGINAYSIKRYGCGQDTYDFYIIEDAIYIESKIG